jgi:altronate hydrolase
MTPTPAGTRADARDTVFTATRALSAGERLEVAGVHLEVCDSVPAWHKVALTEIAQGEAVLKFGRRIGIAMRSIRAGQHVHSHNLKTAQDQR